MSYDRPDKGSGFAPSDHPEWEGQLFIFWPESMENVVYQKQNGEPDPTDVVTADVAIITLNDPQTGRPVFMKQARIGGKALTPMIKNKLGKTVLGKLVKLPKQPGKNAAFALEFPPETPDGEAQWQQWTAMAQQYEQNHPRQQYEPPATNGAASWQTNTSPAVAAQSASTPAQSWGQASPSTTQQWQQGPPPVAQGPNGATPTGTSASANAGPQWGVQSPSPAPASAPLTAAQVADKLKAHGYDLSQIPDEQTARQIAATLQ